MGFRTHDPMPYPILDTKILSKFEGWKQEVPEVSHDFQNSFHI